MKHIAAAIIITIPTLAFAAGIFGSVSASNMGFASATALSGGVTSSAIDMGATSQSAPYTKITLLMTLVWGTSTTMTVTGQYSYDGTNYFTISRCTSATTHVCAPRVWQFSSAGGTTPVLEYQTSAPYLKFTFTATGSGTIVVSGIRSN